MQYLEINKEEKTPPLLQFHGDSDTIVPIEWGKETYDNLKKLGVNATFVPLKNIKHELIVTEIQDFKQWVNNILPE